MVLDKILLVCLVVVLVLGTGFNVLDESTEDGTTAELSISEMERGVRAFLQQSKELLMDGGASGEDVNGGASGETVNGGASGEAMNGGANDGAYNVDSDMRESMSEPEEQQGHSSALRPVPLRRSETYLIDNAFVSFNADSQEDSLDSH